MKSLAEIESNIRCIYVNQFVSPGCIKDGMYAAEVRLPNGLTGSVVFGYNER
jgi:hypothetical protein